MTGTTATSGDVRAIADLDRVAVSRLLAFASRSARPSGGFGSLDEEGRVDPSAPLSCMVNARMTFTFGVASLLGLGEYAPSATGGVAFLTERFADPQYGGFYHSILPAGAAEDRPGTDSGASREPTGDLRKCAYETAFVVLAAATAGRAGIPGAAELLTRALEELDRYFWRPERGCFADAWDREHRAMEPYFGANANMHAVEALMAAAGATGDRGLLERALTIATTFVDRHARAHDWLLPEHYDLHGRAMPGFNADRPADEFKPFGVTVGHLLEWSRLLVELDDALGGTAPWLLPAAEALYDRGASAGWGADGAEGFVYTLDFDLRPVVRHRPHWTVAEALSASATLWSVTRSPRYGADFRRWRRYAERYLVEERTGSWYHELDPDNRPAARFWPGRPDAYHVLQALLIPALPPASNLADRLARHQERP